MNREQIIARIRALKQERTQAMTERAALDERIARIRTLIGGLGTAPTLGKLTECIAGLRQLIGDDWDDK